MKNFFVKFIELMELLNNNDVDYILIGGMAINLHGFARNTEDIDIFINPTEENVKRFRKSLFDVFKDKEIDEITIEELIKYPIIRYGTKFGFSIDIITQIGEKFFFKDLNYNIKTLNGTDVKFADLKTLYRLKEKTYREIDQLDLKFIKSKLDENVN
jgi:acylphosphatase